MNKNKKYRAGIMALFPAIIISGILLMMTVGSSQSFLSMIWRTSLIENKVQSVSLVRSCLRRAVARLMQNFDYAGGDNINIQGWLCKIKLFGVKDQVYSIEVSVAIGGAESVDKADFNKLTQAILGEETF